MGNKAMNENKAMEKPNKGTQKEVAKHTQTFKADPTENTSIICGNNILFLGGEVLSITIEKL